MVPTLITDLTDFISARIACRKHVLINFTISHEPNKLINGPIWGAKLFNASQVSGLFGDAERQNQNLRSRWGVPMKRKYSELFGLLPKNLQLKTQRPTFHHNPPAHQAVCAGPQQEMRYQRPYGHTSALKTRICSSSAFNQTIRRKPFQGYPKNPRGGAGFKPRGRGAPRGAGRGQYGGRGVRGARGGQ